MLKRSYPSWDSPGCRPRAFWGNEDGPHYTFQSKTSVFRTMCIPSTALGFPAKSLFQKGLGVEKKAAAAGGQWLWERKVCTGLVFQGHLELLRGTWFTASWVGRSHGADQ